MGRREGGRRKRAREYVCRRLTQVCSHKIKPYKDGIKNLLGYWAYRCHLQKWVLLAGDLCEHWFLSFHCLNKKVKNLYRRLTSTSFYCNLHSKLWLLLLLKKKYLQGFTHFLQRKQCFHGLPSYLKKSKSCMYLKSIIWHIISLLFLLYLCSTLSLCASQSPLLEMCPYR